MYVHSKNPNAKSIVGDSLSSLKWLHYFIPGINSSNNPLNDDFLARIVDSSKRNIINKKHRKKPLTTEIIKKLIENIPPKASLKQLRDALIPSLAFTLLLRHDEISHVNCNHFTETNEGLKMTIPSSKTDTYREGKTAFLSKSNKAVFDLFFRYLSKAQLNFHQNHFLFGPIVVSGSNGLSSLKNQKLSYDTFRAIIKSAVSSLGLDPKDYSTHSARSGGATALSSLSSEYGLMLSGGWSDPRSLGSYIEIPQTDRFSISGRLDINTNNSLPSCSETNSLSNNRPLGVIRKLAVKASPSLKGSN